MGGQLQLAGQQTGLPGTPVLALGPFLVAMSAVVDEAQVTLVSGNNTVTVIAGSVGVAVIAPAGGATALTYKGIAGDTGTRMAPAGLALLQIWDPAAIPASFVINAGGTVTVTVRQF